MVRVNSCICGLGEVGSAVKEVLSEVGYEVFGLDLNTEITFDECEYLNICIPYSDSFVDIVNNYVDKFKPSLTIIHSTVPVKTTRKIKGLAVNSPVRGKHPFLADGLRKYIKYVGYNDEQSYLLAKGYLEKAFTCNFIKNSDVTEFMKLASLAFYLVYLAVADEVNELSKKLGIPFGEVKGWIMTQNAEIDKFYDNMRWPIISPPEGKPGGHCVMPVTKLFFGECLNAGISAKVIQEALARYSGI